MDTPSHSEPIPLLEQLAEGAEPARQQRFGEGGIGIRATSPSSMARSACFMHRSGQPCFTQA